MASPPPANPLPSSSSAFPKSAPISFYTQLPRNRKRAAPYPRFSLSRTTGPIHLMEFSCLTNYPDTLILFDIDWQYLEYYNKNFPDLPQNELYTSGLLVSKAAIWDGAPGLASKLKPIDVDRTIKPFESTLEDDFEDAKSVMDDPQSFHFVLLSDLKENVQHILDIVHCRFDKVSECINTQWMTEKVEAMAKYSCLHLLLPWKQQWLKDLDTTDFGHQEIDDWARTAHLLDLPDTEARAMMGLTRMVSSISLCGTYAITDTPIMYHFKNRVCVLKVRKYPKENIQYMTDARRIAISKIIDLVRGLLNLLADSEAPDPSAECKEMQCRMVALGSLTVSLNKLSLWPLLASVSAKPETWHASVARLLCQVHCLEMKTLHRTPGPSAATDADTDSIRCIDTPKTGQLSSDGPSITSGIGNPIVSGSDLAWLGELSSRYAVRFPARSNFNCPIAAKLVVLKMRATNVYIEIDGIFTRNNNAESDAAGSH